MWLQEISIPTPCVGHWKFQREGGVSKAKFIKRGCGVWPQTKNPSLGVLWIFSGTMHFTLAMLSHIIYIFFHIRVAIGRNLIPRYFRSIFEGGVKELYYHVVQPKESYHNNTSTITLDCENTTMITHHKMPVFTKVCIAGGLFLFRWSSVLPRLTKAIY